ncbi:MAG TPA: CHAP domain-containing protein [Candidatus Saccharimonadales bacterium]|jgi:surface antigen|nr:CHAP domain-containing protein [Candidatus Saccharimonadales bacterium]
MIAVGYQAPVSTNKASADTGVNSNAAIQQANPTVDQVAAANLAAAAAQSADILVGSNVNNLSRSLNAKSEMAQTDTVLLNKPQIFDQTTNVRGIHTYVTKTGDTVQQVAASFGVSEDTIRWANNLLSDALGPNITLKIPSTTGVIYTVKAGDTADQLATKYQTDKDRITTYNDAELTGLQPGQQIIIPGGVLPANERPGATGTSRSSSSSSILTNRLTVFGGNGYDYGYCTWYAFNRRAELGRPVGSNWGNAVTWASYARSAGFKVDNTPEVGAVLQAGGYYGLGHVAIVERVNGDGSITLSEMNYAGWNVISSRTLSAGQAAAYNYIH